MTKKVGLALGSGGVKGIAHIGVLQVLEENGIPIHMISGSSAGAIMGAIFAVGTDLDMLGRFIAAIDSRDFLDMTVPRTGRGGIIKGDILEEMVRVFTHDKTFEETRIPFYCLAVDVETGERLVFDREKKLHECVRASMSIPGVFTPVRIDNRLLVDGGVLERVPIQVLKEAGADVIIGVDVGYRGGPRRIEQVTVRHVLDNTVDMMQWEIARLREDGVQIMLTPHVIEMMKGFSTENTMDCIQEGRRVTEEALPKLLEVLAGHDIPLKRARALTT